MKNLKTPKFDKTKPYNLRCGPGKDFYEQNGLYYDWDGDVMTEEQILQYRKSVMFPFENNSSTPEKELNQFDEILGIE